MSIAIGSTCCGWFGTDNATYIDEIRKLTVDRHEPIYSQTLHKNLSLKRQLIINFDSYNDGDRGWKSEQILRQLIENTINETRNVGALYGLSNANVRQLVTLTFDNEADEIYSIEAYCYLARIFIDQVKGRFDIGLGNFDGLRANEYEYICANVTGFKYLDIHMQKDFESINKVNTNTDILQKIANKYNKILRVTEAFPVTENLWTQSGYNLLLHQLNTAIKYNAKAFCCFIRFDRGGEYNKLAFLRGNEIHPNWNEFKKIIEDNKVIIKIEENKNMKLELLKIGSKGMQVKWLQEILAEEYGFENVGGYDGKFGALTDKQVRDYQASKNLKVDGIVGSQTTFDLIWYADSFEKDYWFKKLQIYMAFQ